MIQSIKNDLKKFTYKPGYLFSADEENDGIRIELLVFNLIDVDRQDRLINIAFTKRFSSEQAYCTDLAVLVKETVLAWEMHEMDEWLKYCGKCIRTPSGHGKV